MQLNNNTILVTGGTSGIGLSFVRALHEKKNKLIVCGSNLAKLDQVRSQIPDVISYQCDLSDSGSITQFSQKIKSSHPDLNVLINNAGIQNNYLFPDGNDHSIHIRSEIEVNLTAPILLTDQLLPLLLEKNSAAIINVTSGLALAPKKSASVYCATKAGLASFSDSLRYQLEDSKVEVIEIVPALVDTAMTQGRGSGKISPEALVKEALCGMEKGREKILINKTKFLFALNRVAPGMVKRLMANA